MIQMITYSGRLIDLDRVKTEDICMSDIAFGLDVARFSGHARSRGFHRPYTVAQHSCQLHDWFLARGQRVEAKYALLHDAAEAYLGDLHAGLKASLPAFQTREEALMQLILGKYKVGRLTKKVKEAVHEADHAILREELEFFWPERDWGARPGDAPRIDSVWPAPGGSFLRRAERYWKC